MSLGSFLFIYLSVQQTHFFFSSHASSCVVLRYICFVFVKDATRKIFTSQFRLIDILIMMYNYGGLVFFHIFFYSYLPPKVRRHNFSTSTHITAITGTNSWGNKWMQWRQASRKRVRKRKKMCKVWNNFTPEMIIYNVYRGRTSMITSTRKSIVASSFNIAYHY